MLRKRNWLVLMAAAFLFAACGDSEDVLQDLRDNLPDPDVTASADEMACAHLIEGPFKDIVATTMGADDSEPVDAGVIEADHHAYRVELPLDARGYAKFENLEEGDYAIYMDTDVHFHVREWDSEGDRHTVPLEHSATSVDDCDEVKARHIVDLSEGTYYLDFGSGFEGETVTVVILPADDEAHEETDAVAAINEEGCYHMEHGPFTDISAAPMGEDDSEPVDAGVVDTDHHAYRVELPLDERGYAMFQSPDAMDYVIFMDTDVHFHMREWDSEGDRHTVPLEDSQTSVAQCDIVKARHQVELGIGTYYLDFGNGYEGETVTVVIEPFEDDYDTEHAHD